MNKGINVNTLVSEFNLTVIGSTDDPILYPGSLKKHDKNSILWTKNVDNLNQIQAGYIIVNYEIAPTSLRLGVTYLVTEEKARLVYAKIMNKYFESEDDAFFNYVEEHKRNSKIRIADNCFIGKDVEIGDGTVIHPNVVIHSRTRIGKNCVIKTHVSLGTEGLGLELDKETDEFVKFPQLGGVILEDNVEIGPCSTVRRSALDDTIIMKGTKIGSLVNVGHNCIIGKNCILTCQIVTSGSSVIGDNVFMGVSSIVKNGVNIGSNVTVGQGAVVTKNIPDNAVYVGNPAEDINDYKLWSRLKKHLIKKFGPDLKEP
jgi:UDP-3-O-[3-hydroxymyristoyl] glucosamine N-acyltransferase